MYVLIATGIAVLAVLVLTGAYRVLKAAHTRPAPPEGHSDAEGSSHSHELALA
jgi:hypothetical protein